MDFGQKPGIRVGTPRRYTSMLWIFQFLLRHRTLTSLTITVTLSLWMLSGPPAQQQRTSRTLLMTAFFPLQYTLSLTSSVRDIFAENKRLRSEVAALRMKEAMLEEKAAESQRLRQMIGFAENFSHDLIPARVMMRDPAPLFGSVVISAGAKQGIGTFMPVIAQNGVIGRVVQVLPSISLVQLLRDPTARTGVMIRRTRVSSILESPNRRDYFFRFRVHFDVAEGDTVVTSGLGGIYPAGIQVGLVKKIAPDANQLFSQAHVALVVDFERLEEVFVVRLSPQWSAFRAEVDSLRMPQ